MHIAVKFGQPVESSLHSSAFKAGRIDVGINNIRRKQFHLCRLLCNHQEFHFVARMASLICKYLVILLKRVSAAVDFVIII